MAGFGAIGYNDDPFWRPDDPLGELETGNIDLTKRPVVKNDDGTISTVRSMDVHMDPNKRGRLGAGVGPDGEPLGPRVLVPTVYGQHVLSDEDALRLYNMTGKHLGQFDTAKNAVAYADQLHKDQAARYGSMARPAPVPVAYDPMTGLPIGAEDAPPDAPVAPSFGPGMSGIAGETLRRLTGTEFGQPRLQLWPEKMVRSAVTLPGDVYTGKETLLPPGLRREDYTDIPAPQGPTEDSTRLGKAMGWAPGSWQPNDPVYERAQDTAGLAGGGLVFGSLARPGAAVPSFGRGARVFGKRIGSDEPFPHQLIDQPANLTEPYIGPQHQPHLRAPVEARIDAELGRAANDRGPTLVQDTGRTLLEDSATPGAPLSAIERMEQGKGLAVERRNRGFATGKPAAGHEFKRPDPEPGSFDALAAEARARHAAQRTEPDSPLLTEADKKFIREGKFYEDATPAGAPIAALEHMGPAGEYTRLMDVAAPAIKKTKIIDEQGNPIQGPAYAKEARAVLQDIEKGPKGAGPMDITLQGRVPDVPQVDLPRYEPPRGVTPRLREALETPSVQEGLRQSMEAGRGVENWYHTEPVRRAFIDELGPEKGAAEFGRYMDTVAATSPRSDVPTNVRNASYYYQKGTPEALPAKNPYPYGHVAQNLHRQNFGTIAREAGWDPFQNPKPASFAQNLRGNLEPVTVDTHAFRNIAMRTGDPRFLETSISQKLKAGVERGPNSLVGRFGEVTGNKVVFRPQKLLKEGKLTMEEAKSIPTFWASKPTKGEYGAAEQAFKRAGEDLGMRPADAQAAAWAGGGEMTGLGTVGTHTFPELMNERVLFTARMRGESPQKVLSDFIRGKATLLEDAATAGAPIAALENASKFYSKLEREVEAIKQPAMKAEAWLGTLTNKGIKPEEMQYSGLSDFLAERAGKQVSRKEIAAHVASNKLELGEVTKTGEGTKYKAYQLTGGENYREKLLTLPTPERPPITRHYLLDENGERIASGSDQNILDRWRGRDPNARIETVQEPDTRVVKRDNEYRSSHWDEPNVLAHRRTNERDVVGVNGPNDVRRSAHIEELQSDWHQAGRKQGYAREEPVYWAENKRSGHVSQKFASKEEADAYMAQLPESIRGSVELKTGNKKIEGVPDAPFKKNWHELAVKDAIREAAEKGLDRISWTPGKAQAERYSLAKQFDEISANPSVHKGQPSKTWWAKDKQGRGHDSIVTDLDGKIVQAGRAWPGDLVGKHISDVVGGDVAKKGLMEGPQKIEGIDLTVGGEGMKGFYDKMVPDALNKIGKPHGVKVQSGKTPLDRPGWDIVDTDGASYATYKGPPTKEQMQRIADSEGVPIETLSARQNKGSEGDVHYMDIPQSLKDEALKKGFSLFEDATPAGAPLAALEHQKPAAQYHALLDKPPEPAYKPADVAETAAAREAPPAAGTRGDVTGGAGGGDARLQQAATEAERRAGAEKPLEGLPRKAMKIGDEYFVPGPIAKVKEVANDYMSTRDTPSYHKQPEKYHPLDEDHSRAIAKAFDEMKHDPDNPAVKHSYDAMINETKAQYKAIEKTGLKIEPIEPGMPDPYAANPRLAAKDVADNNHLWYFPTDAGFGSNAAAGIDMAKHPMMQPTGIKLGDRELLANDLFRIVHDYFGHLKEGYGFRAAGEDNAWRSHASMYSDLARPAMTTETRGQNSWVNYGPHGEKNRTASAADTTYADQKVGLMPEWTMRDRGSAEPIIAYHGGPHSFEKFDMSKIGTGEGNQAYGHGLYFAGHSPVSEWYRHQLSARRDPLLKKYGLESEDGARMGIDLANSKGDPKPVIKGLREYIAENQKRRDEGDRSKATANIIERSEKMVRYLQDPNRFKGHMYEVAIDAPKEKFLNWDKPISEQPKEAQAFFSKELGIPMEARRPAGELYEQFAKKKGQKQASEAMKAAGIPGIVYLDQASRSGGKGTSNYVTFDSPRLLKKYATGGPPFSIARDPKEDRR